MDCEEFSQADGLAPSSKIALIDVELEGMAAALAAYFAVGSKQGHRRRPGCPTNSMARSTHLNGVSEPNASMDVQVNRGSVFDGEGGPECPAAACNSDGGQFRVSLTYGESGRFTTLPS